MKRVLSFVLAITMLLSLFAGLSISANATDPSVTFVADNPNLTINDDELWFKVSGENLDENSWFGLYAPGEVPVVNTSITWQYMSNINGTWVEFRHDNGGHLVWSNGRSEWYGYPAGTYTLAVIAGDNTTVIDSTTFTITNPKVSFSFDKETYYTGDDVLLTVTNNGIETDSWISIFAPGKKINESSNAWVYTGSDAEKTYTINSGSADFTWQEQTNFGAGTYAVGLFDPNGNVTAVTHFKIQNPENVKPAVSFSFDKESYEIGETVALTINATDIPAGSWLGVYAPGVSDPSYGWTMLDGNISKTINLVPGNAELEKWNQSAPFYAGDWSVGLYDSSNALIGEAATFTVNAAPTPATYELSMSKTGDSIIYYDCQNEDPVFTVTAENFSDTDWVGVYRDYEIPGGEWEAIKYAYIKDINAQAISIRSYDGWYDGLTRVGHKNLPADNYKLVICLNDGYGVVESLNFKVREHLPVTLEAVAPTCTETGLTVGSKCALCETVLDAQETVDALDHEFSNWTETTAAVDPTCTEAGKTAIETGYCTRCEATTTRGGDEIAPLPHDEYVSDPGEEATCEKSGLTDEISCRICEQVIHEQTLIPPTGVHVYGEWKVTKKPTCAEEGIETRVCIYNKTHKEERAIPVTDDHSFAYTIESYATTEQPGKVVNKCTLCGKVASAATATITVPQIGKITLEKNSYVYDGTAKTPAVTVKDVDGNVIDAANYEISYAGNTVVGTASVSITFKGYYEGTVTQNFKIVLAKPDVKVSKVTASSVTLKWNKVKGVSGTTYYKVYSYDTKTKKTKKLAETTSTSYTVSKKAAGTTYHFIVRAYSKKNGKEIASPVPDAKDAVKAVTLCAAPTVKASVSKKNVTLKWKKVTGAKYYTIYKYNTKTKKLTTLVKSTTKLSYTLKNQPKGTNKYLVRAYNANKAASAYTTKNLASAKVK